MDWYMIAFVIGFGLMLKLMFIIADVIFSAAFNQKTVSPNKKW